MIIQIRGTSGSGKSTVMRTVMGNSRLWNAVIEPPRRKPLFYLNDSDWAVLGHYETQCGGCDTIGSAKAVYDLIGTFRGTNILCEGLLLSEDTKWTLQMSDVRVLYLATDVEECIRRIQKRRREAGNDKPLNESNTRNRVAVIDRSRVKLETAGVYCRRAPSTQAPRIIQRWINDAK